MKTLRKASVPRLQVLSVATALLALLALQGCARPKSVNQEAFLALREAGYTRAHAGEWAEAYAIALLLEQADASDPKVPALKDACLKKSVAVRDLEDRRWLGGNHALRTETWPSPILAAILLYPVNVVADIVDLASFEIGVGVGLGARVKATEPLALGLQAEMGEALIGWKNGRLSARTGADNAIDLLGLEFRNGYYAADRQYGGARVPFITDGLKQPGAPPYALSTDYYGIGGHVMAGLLALHLEFHPVQLVDAVAGLLFIDPMNDGYIVNRPIRLSPEEKDAARRLFE